MIKTLILKYRKKISLPSLPKKSLIGKELLYAVGSISLLWQILFFYLPLSVLLLTSFLEVDSAGKISGLSLIHFKHILNFTYYKVIVNSLLLSLYTAVLTLLIAFPLTYFIVFRTGKWKYMLLFFLIIPFWTNFLLHIYAWFFILEKNGLINQFLIYTGLIKTPLHLLNTSFASLLLMVYYYLPFMALPIFSALERFDTSYFEASTTLGASKIKTFTKIVFPMIQKAIITGFFLVFIPAFGEFLIPEFIGGDKIYYVGNVISIHLIGETSGPIGLAFTTLSLSILLICSYAIYVGFKALFNAMQGGSYDKL
ncbi:MAG: Spermidine/putrescine transport system permease protein PotB [Chlamydiia bacterium]|nr:Spermidine/putrescine transport system permease protein PotB [Chlamydiia bacterium]MCH9618010.1 Spermidine/putrescine transport system permease protein PotB [Chlamydiia bacterium]MCH9623665.1 Spermidine/putrescine transport system permease protein PotB [Chlamydiia bacterium]